MFIQNKNGRAGAEESLAASFAKFEAQGNKMIQFKNDQIIVFTSSLYKTTSSLIHTPDLLLLVDPNWLPQELEAIRRELDSIRKDNRPFYLLFTHSDFDHILGYGAFPGARVIASDFFSKNKEKENIVEQILKWDAEYYISRDYPIEYPGVDFPIKREGQTLEIGNTRLTFYLAPGHTGDGIFAIVEPTDEGIEETENGKRPAIWIAGDYLSDVEFPFIYFSSNDYERTLEKVDLILEKHNIQLMIPGHGSAAFYRDEIRKRQQEAIQYLRTLRECLERGIDFPMEKLWERYAYSRGLAPCHEENIRFLRSELGL